ncbi:MAG: VWA domain-containing protein [Gemmatimonadetes bacterium]|nr:VWA domain-containing protein [Gemmatimonadota bacterium]
MQSIFEFLFKYRPLVFAEGRLTFQAPLPLLTLILISAALASVAAWTYLRVGGRAAPRDRALLAGLRVGALALLAFCLMRPALVLSTVVPQQNFVGVLIDDSQSMRIADGEAARSAFVADGFGPESALRKSLEDRFQLRWFRFASDVERLSDPAQLGFDGTRTRLAPALDRAREELAPVPLSGLIVVTDGADNAGGALTESLLALKAAQIPVYTVGLGRERYEKDIELVRVSTPESVIKGASLVVDLLVSQSGFTGQTVQVQVEDAGRIVGTETVELSGTEPVPVRVRFTAADAGPRRFRFRVPAQAGELVLENNDQEALIMVRDQRDKILYFEGEPRHEVAFLRRAVDDDENLQVVVLQRTAENKYLRLSVDSAEELAGGFPKSRDELFAYRGLILGSVEASHFTHEQLRMIAAFVSQRGGGLLVLGGRKSFMEGGYAGTPLADVLPVELDPSGGIDTTFFTMIRVRPTRAGLTHAATQIAPTEKESGERWAGLPELSTFNQFAGLKPGATALLTGAGPGLRAEQPVLAFQRFGRGLSVALAVQDTWMWQMHADVPLEDMTHETLWRQLLRWLVNGVPGQIVATLPSDRAAPGESVRIHAGVFDPGYLEVNNARVVAHVKQPSGPVIAVPLEWTIDEDGEYAGRFTALETGLHEILVEAKRGDETLATAPAWLEVTDSRAEFFGSEMNRPLLERIAKETDGRFYTPASIASLSEDLSITGRGSTVVEVRDLWDMPILLLLLVGLIGAEWAWRRRKGLA